MKRSLFLTLLISMTLLSVTGCFTVPCPEHCQEMQDEISALQEQVRDIEHQDVSELIIPAGCELKTEADRADAEPGMIKNYGKILYHCPTPAAESALAQAFGDLVNRQAKLQRRRDELWEELKATCPCADGGGELRLQKCIQCDKMQANRCPFEYLIPQECSAVGGELEGASEDTPAPEAGQST